MKTEFPDRPVVLLAENDQRSIVLVRRTLIRLNSLRQLVWMSNGARTKAYLEGDGVFSNRVIWPLPNLTILDTCSTGMELLRWIRRDPGFCNLPVVMLSEGLQPPNGELSGECEAGCCAKCDDFREFMERMATAMCAAFRLTWFASHGRPPATPGHLPVPSGAPSLSAGYVGKPAVGEPSKTVSSASN